MQQQMHNAVKIPSMRPFEHFQLCWLLMLFIYMYVCMFFVFASLFGIYAILFHTFVYLLKILISHLNAMNAPAHACAHTINSI